MTSACFADGIKDGVRQDKVAQDWAARGYSCEMWVDPPDQVWLDYVHDHDELLMPVTGRLLVEFGGESHRLEPGQEIRIPANQKHSVRSLSHTTVCWLYGHRN